MTTDTDDETGSETTKDTDRVGRYGLLKLLGLSGVGLGIGTVQSVEDHAMYRFDPVAHESQAIATLQSLRDDAIDVTASSQ